MRSLRDSADLVRKDGSRAVRQSCDCQRQGGRRLGGWHGQPRQTVGHAVKRDAPKALCRRGGRCEVRPGSGQVRGPGADRVVAGEQTGPTPSREHMRNVVSPYSSREGKRAARRTVRGSGMGSRRKRMPSCNGADTGRVPGARACRLPRGLSSRENVAKRPREQGR